MWSRGYDPFTTNYMQVQGNPIICWWRKPAWGILIWIPVVYWWRESILGIGTVLTVIIATQVSNVLMDTEDVFRRLVGHNLPWSFTCFLRWFHDLVLIVVRVSSICPGAKDKTDLSVWLMSEYFFKVMKAWKLPVKHWARRVQNQLGYIFISW